MSNIGIRTEIPNGIAMSPEMLQHAPETLPDLGNKDLRIYEQKAQIIEALNTNQVVLIVAPTGTGKSTQVPQYALEAGFERVVLTQPRRRPAQNVAERIQEELAEGLGAEHAAELVSYHTGAGLVGSREAVVQVKTEGLLSRQEAYRPSDGDNELWILDELHEQSKEQFKLKGLAKEKLRDNPEFTVVAMTATMNKFEMIDFFTDQYGQEPVVIELTGETMFPIEHRIETQSNTVKEAVKAAMDIFDNPEAHDAANTIQVFESGVNEINDTIDAIRARLPKDVLEKTIILKNHAKLKPHEQAPVYQDHDGIKIVVQTNIGKTSMTIPRTRVVITSGKERLIEVDDEYVDALLEMDSTQDDMMQIKGRGGRTCTSIFIETRHDGQAFVPMSERAAHLQPEILRTTIDDVVLYLASTGRNIHDFDGAEIIPEASIARSIRRNQALGALDGQGIVTDIGKKMAQFPCSPERARSLVEAEKHPMRIRLYMAALVAASESGGLKIFEHGRTTNWEELSEEVTSDALSQLDTFIATQGKKLREMDILDVDTNNLIRTEQSFRKIAKVLGVVDIPELKLPTEAERAVLRECIAAGYAHSVYLPYGEGLFKHVGELITPREISNRSVVGETRSAIVGRARNVQMKKSGKAVMKHIVEDVTVVSEDSLRASSLANWVDAGFTMRGGKLKQIKQQYFGPKILDVREDAAVPSPQLRAAVIERVKSNPGPSLIELYTIKKKLEQLAHKTNRPIPRLTQDMINIMIEEAAPEAVNDPGHVEEMLRQRIVEEGISLTTFISVEAQEEIHRNAPLGVVFGPYTLKLSYDNGKVTAKRFTLPMLKAIGDDPRLPDGREICFMYDDKRHTLSQLKRKLRNNRIEMD